MFTVPVKPPGFPILPARPLLCGEGMAQPLRLTKTEGAPVTCRDPGMERHLAHASTGAGLPSNAGSVSGCASGARVPARNVASHRARTAVIRPTQATAVTANAAKPGP